MERKICYTEGKRSVDNKNGKEEREMKPLKGNYEERNKK